MTNLEQSHLSKINKELKVKQGK